MDGKQGKAEGKKKQQAPVGACFCHKKQMERKIEIGKNERNDYRLDESVKTGFIEVPIYNPRGMALKSLGKFGGIDEYEINEMNNSSFEVPQL